MSIIDWPIEDRPREKLLMKGEQALTDTELIAILLKTGMRGCSALEIAKKLMVQYGDLKQLMNAPQTELIKQKGIGTAKYVTLRAAIELGKRYLQEYMPQGTVLNNNQIAQKFLTIHFQAYQHEVFACLFLDMQFRLLHFAEMFHGSISEANIYPREIVKYAIKYNAAKIILTHNHPSGNTTPSEADKQITTLIIQALKFIEVEVVDHIIVGAGKYFSFAEAKLII